MIFTLIALAALLASPAGLTGGPVADPAALLPANTILYVGTPSLQAGAEASKNSAMRKILDEPEVKAFLQKPVSAADKSLQELIAKSGLPPEATPKISLASMLSGEGGGVPIGRFFVALTHVSLPAPGAAGPGEPDVGLVLGIEMQNASDLGLVKALWGMIKAPETSATHGKTSYMVKKIEGGPPVVLGFVDKLAVISLSEKSLGAILDNAAAASGASLADTAEYKQASGLGGGMHPDSSSWFFRVGQLADMGRSLMGIVAMSHTDMKELAGVSALLDQTGLSSIHWVGGEGHREADGRVITTMGVSVAPDATGLVGKCMAANAQVDLGLLSQVPGNCLSASAFGVDWLPYVYDFAMTTIETVAPEEAPGINAKIKEFMGTASLRDDLLANPHGVALLYGMPGEGFPGQPSTIVKVGLRDPQKFVGAMNALAAGVAAQFPDNFSGLKINTSDHEGHPFYEIDLSSTIAAAVMLQPAFALDGDNVVLCLQSSKALKTALNGLQGAGSLADNSELMTFAKGLAAKGKVTSLSFSDNAKSFGTVYGQLAPAVGMMSGMFGALPVDFSLMPTEQAIGKHLGYSYDGTYDAGGGLEVGRGVAEFALGDFVPLLLTSGVIAVGVITGEGMGEAQAAPELSPEEQVQNDLQQLSAAMTVYKISQGGYPKELTDLVKPLPDYEEGCLGKPDLPVDPWGSSYLFKLNEKKKPFLWSAGPNKMDEGGAGDDIAKK
jgi:hypothetical protein